MPGMLNNFKKNIKTFVKTVPNLHSTINTKTAIYFGLAAYWGLILFGTFINI